MGFTGWLDPEGQFHPCRYGEHYMLAQEVLDSGLPYDSYDRLKEEKHYIPMGVSPNSSESYVFIHIDEKLLEPSITKEQIQWFKDNFHNLDRGQKTMVFDWLEDELQGISG